MAIPPTHTPRLRAVVFDLSLVDDDRPPAQRFNVFHIVTGQQDGHLLFRLIVSEETLDLSL